MRKMVTFSNTIRNNTHERENPITQAIGNKKGGSRYQSAVTRNNQRLCAGVDPMGLLEVHVILITKKARHIFEVGFVLE